MLDGPASPPSDLADTDLPIEAIDPGEILYRIHRIGDGPKFFGRTGNWRFNSPAGAFGTMYAGLSPDVAFAETLIRGRGSLVAFSEIEIRSLCRFRVARPIRVVRMFGPSLTRLRAGADVTSGDMSVSRSWAQALHDHPQEPDGIKYRSKYDNDEFAVALFERCSSSFDGGTMAPLADDATLLGAIFDRYDLALSK